MYSVCVHSQLSSVYVYSLWNIFGHDSIEAVEHISPGHAERDKGKEELGPTAGRVETNVP